jgi:23S rRNA pseudouridine2605 synthase
VSPSDSSPKNTPERLQKIIAQAGIASRRDAEELIRDGLVTVNGKVSALGDKAVWGQDAIKVNGKLLHTPAVKVYYLVYKPKNVIAMLNEDEEGRPTLKDFVKRIKERVFPVGRMDFTGEGAILLTNDGDITQKILKSNEIIRRYHVKVGRQPSTEDLARLARGGRIEDRSMQPYHVRLVQNYAKNALIEISFEGMGSTEVKKYLENKGFIAEKIARVGIGHLSVEKMAPGTFKRIEASSVQALLTQPELAKRQIAALTESKKSEVKVVSEGTLKKDAEKKRMGRKGIFVEGGADARKTSRRPAVQVRFRKPTPS